MDQISPREGDILDTLISTYIATGEPVGSRTVSRSGLGLSAATVRNSMADLEDKGYLRQPHTSAGRVPTDKGYRYYVDRLMAEEALPESARDVIRSTFEARIRERNIEDVLEQVSKVLAEVSLNLGVVMAPRFERGMFGRLDMVRLSESKLLLVLTIASGLVKTMVIEVDATIDRSELEATQQTINERLSGLTVGEIRRSVGERLRSVSRGSPRLLRLLAGNADTIFKFSTAEDLHFGGTRNFFLQPEFTSNQEGLAALLGLLEDREPIVAILDERMDLDGITITIGNENTSPELQSCSLLTSRYRMGNVSGVIGMIGPTRLPYARLVPLIQYIADLTEEMLEKQ